MKSPNKKRFPRTKPVLIRLAEIEFLAVKGISYKRDTPIASLLYDALRPFLDAAQDEAFPPEEPHEP